MQQLKRTRHPSGTEVLFDAKWHQYRLGGTVLRSVSKLLDRYFPFDEKRVLELVSKKTGQPVDKIRQGWSRQALLGKNVHAFIESKLLKKPPPSFTLLMKRKQAREAARSADATGPAAITTIPLEDEVLHGEEALYLPVAEAAVEKVLSTYEVLGVEQVIASPEWGIAGTIDFMGRNRHTNRILIGDWKTTGSVTSNFRFGSFEAPCRGVLRHLPNSKAYRYAMQVIVYGEILSHEQYFERKFFDAQLRESLAAASAGSSTEGTSSAPPEKARQRSKSRASASSKPATDSHVESLLKTFYRNNAEQRFEYGIVQLMKDDDGSVVAEFVEVTPATVLPPDSPELTFESLLRRVMEGEGV